MKPSKERAALEAVRRAIRSLTELEELLPRVFAMDDEPSGVSPERVADGARLLAGRLIAIGFAAHTLRGFAKRLLVVPAVDPVRYKAPECPACSGPAARAKRGLCDDCYAAWVAEDRPELQPWVLRVKARGTVECEDASTS